MIYAKPKYEKEAIETEDIILASGGGNITEDGVEGEEIPLP